jgi:hypothetical protein
VLCRLPEAAATAGVAAVVRVEYLRWRCAATVVAAEGAARRWAAVAAATRGLRAARVGVADPEGPNPERGLDLERGRDPERGLDLERGRDPERGLPIKST